MFSTQEKKTSLWNHTNRVVNVSFNQQSAIPSTEYKITDIRVITQHAYLGQLMSNSHVELLREFDNFLRL